ncbi:uncharacterized protein LOC135123963 [Zophobas morio]|uniref:uncharacterized protein LOC135123963 n=1 Tax=Zophobas morio TaxID=2755281 RepID=UPI003082DEE6
MVKNCWMNLTPFQLACVLILVVAIPFFIAMLVIYLMYGVIWYKSEQCQNLCCSLDRKNVLSRGPDDKIPIDEKTGKDTLQEFKIPPPLQEKSPEAPPREEPIIPEPPQERETPEPPQEEPTIASPPTIPPQPPQRRPLPLPPEGNGQELQEQLRPRPRRPKRLSERREEIKEETQIPQLFSPSKPSTRLRE